MFLEHVKSEVLRELWTLLEGLRLNIVAVFSDDNFAYHEVISGSMLQTGNGIRGVLSGSI
jgi:hypothetical protein